MRVSSFIYSQASYLPILMLTLLTIVGSSLPTNTLGPIENTIIVLSLMSVGFVASLYNFRVSETSYKRAIYSFLIILNGVILLYFLGLEIRYLTEPLS